MSNVATTAFAPTATASSSTAVFTPGHLVLFLYRCNKVQTGSLRFGGQDKLWFFYYRWHCVRLHRCLDSLVLDVFFSLSLLFSLKAHCATQFSQFGFVVCWIVLKLLPLLDLYPCCSVFLLKWKALRNFVEILNVFFLSFCCCSVLVWLLKMLLATV